MGAELLGMLITTYHWALIQSVVDLELGRAVGVKVH